MSMNYVPNRVQAGVPTAGQFAKLHRGESSVALQSPAPRGDGSMAGRGLDFLRSTMHSHRARVAAKAPGNRSGNARRAKVAIASLALAAAAVTAASGFSTSDDTKCQPAPAAISSYTATTASFGTAPAVFTPPIVPVHGATHQSGSHLKIYWNLPGQPHDGDIVQAAQCAAPGTVSNS